MFVHGKYFYGNEISKYGQEHGYVDYGTLAKSFDAILNNEIIQKTYEIGYWEQESGFVDNAEKIKELQEELELLENTYDDRVSDEEIEQQDEAIEKLQGQIAELEEEQDNAYNVDIYQYYIVSGNGAEILKECNEIVFYNEELDMYVWGVTHWGTAWSYVLTDIKCNVPYEEEE